MSEEIDMNIVLASGATGVKELELKIISDTPQTDRLIYPNGCMSANLLEHARTMERQRDRAIAITDGVMAWDAPADARKSYKDLSQLKKEIGNIDCIKCKGTGWYQYSPDHSTICNSCCKHEEGWWDLTEGYYQFKKDADNGCCRKGCGTLRRDLKQ